MPGYYEHEETMHHTEAEVESEDDQDEQLDAVPPEKPKARPRPPVSADARPSSSKPRPLGRERSKSDVGQRQRTPSPDTVRDKRTQTCPICSQTLVTDNQGLNAHIDFCLSRGAIQEAQGESGATTTPQKARAIKASWATPGNGWDFLMHKDVRPPAKGSKKRK
jgi:DNA polymerase kappa